MSWCPDKFFRTVKNLVAGESLPLCSGRSKAFVGEDRTILYLINIKRSEERRAWLMVVAKIEKIIQGERGVSIHARDQKGILYKFSACPLVFTSTISPKIGLWVTLANLEERPYGFKANKAFCN